MADGKRYYWLKLKEDFFGSKRIKKLRNMAGGDTYLIIYLKLQLKAMKTDGTITFDHLEDNIADELALDLDENPDDIRATLIYLCSCGLAESSDVSIFFPYAVENVGSENTSTQRVREYRERQRALHCNAVVTECNKSETQVKQLCNGEKEKDIEIEKEIEREKEEARPRTPTRFKAPTVEEVQAYCTERRNTVDAKRFVDYYTANGWKVGKNPMKDWKAAVRNWERNEYSNTKSQPETPASYDLQRAEEKAKTTVPKLVKKEKR